MNNNLFEYYRDEFEGILTQTILISQMSNGISYTDVEKMDEYERVFILKKLLKMKKDELEAKKRAIEEAKKK